MKTISLICTVHEESGLANSSVLYSILEQLRPEVIFFEAPAGAFDELLVTGGLRNLESTAVTRYRESKGAVVVSVDLPTPDSRFFERQWEFDERIRGRITDFQRLMAWYKNYTHDSGFRYLNSDDCIKMWSDIYSEIRATLKLLNDSEMNDFFELWVKTNDLRENAMLNNILAYCEQHSFERAVFLIGAAHQKAVIEKSRVIFNAAGSGIQWDFSDAS